ncbi:MAG TPA: hypothetical protein VFC21_07605 [Bryobacteraceae bacterium]|nr:hypothetical protein [Bryobacteraceae bacterium]
MSIQSDLEDALIALLKAEPGLASVKTVEAEIRDCLFSGEKLTQGFRDTELPAINLSATLDPTQRSQFTASEIQHEIPVSICCIARALKRKAAYNAVKEIQEAIENVLDRLRKSSNAIGNNTLLFGNVTSSVTTIQDNPHCFAVGTTAAKITKITTLA